MSFDATDSAVELAQDKNIDLNDYAGEGSGPGGRIWKSDVEQWIEKKRIIAGNVSAALEENEPGVIIEFDDGAVTIGTWAGNKNYECSCGTKTPDIERLKRHLISQH